MRLQDCDLEERLRRLWLAADHVRHMVLEQGVTGGQDVADLLLGLANIVQEHREVWQARRCGLCGRFLRDSEARAACHCVIHAEYLDSQGELF